MKYCFLAMFIAVCFPAKAQPSKAYDYAYTNKKGICVYSIAEKKEYPVMTTGSDPCLSPDGTKIAYTVNRSDGDRQVAVIDLASKRKTTINTGVKNCYGPVWSPDGNYIAYNAFINSNWSIGIIGSDGRSPFIVTKSFPAGSGCYSPTWSADSKKILVQDMENVFVLSTTGNVLAKYTISAMGLTEGGSSSYHFLLTADDAKLVFDFDDDDKGYDEPPSAIFVYDINTHTSKRVTPKGYSCYQPLLKGNRIFFCGAIKKPAQFNIYSVDMDGKNLRLELKNISNLSARP